MNTQKTIRIAFVIVPILIVLTIWFGNLAPLLAVLPIVLLMILKSDSIKTSLSSEPPVYYQPPQQSTVSEPFSQASETVQPKDEHQKNYAADYGEQPDEQPQTQYPQQMPPMA